jgi:hypothetical protein
MRTILRISDRIERLISPLLLLNHLTPFLCMNMKPQLQCNDAMLGSPDDVGKKKGPQNDDMSRQVSPIGSLAEVCLVYVPKAPTISLQYQPPIKLKKMKLATAESQIFITWTCITRAIANIVLITISFPSSHIIVKAFLSRLVDFICVRCRNAMAVAAAV